MVYQKQELPEWYYRLVSITVREDREIYPKDFDEDISNLEEGSEGDGEEQQKEEGNVDYDDDYDDGWDSDRQHKRKEREKDLARHKEKEQEVQKVYDSLGSAKKRKGKGKDKNRKQSLPCFEPTANTRFHLYSTHYITHGPYKSPFPSQYIEFYYSYSIDLPGPEGQYGGHIYIDYGTEYAFQPFFPPKHASLDKHLLKTWDGRHSLTIQFIGDNYLKLKLLRELVRVNESVSQHSMPDLFEFVGIRPGFEMEREERGRAQAKRKRSPSPPSPRESWFEMNHPMEWWNQSRGF